MNKIAPGQCGCGREWWAMGEAHCSSSGCHAHFTSDWAFDLHLAPPQSRDDCYDPKTLNDHKGRRVFKLVQRKSGPTWTTRNDDPHYRSLGDVRVHTQEPRTGPPGYLGTREPSQPLKTSPPNAE